MTPVIIQGILTGLGLTILVGPAFFTMLESTLKYNYKSGLAIATGIILGDAMYVLIALYGVNKLLTDNVSTALGIILILILLIMGVRFILNPPKIQQVEVNLSKKDIFSFFIKGFFVNTVSPFAIVFWVSLVAVTMKNYNDSTKLHTYLAATLATVYVTDCIKVLSAHSIKKILKDNYLKIFFRIIGVFLILYALKIAYTQFF